MRSEPLLVLSANQKLRQLFPGKIMKIFPDRQRLQSLLHSSLFQRTAQQGLFHLGAVPASKKIAVNSTAGDPPLGYPELKLQLPAALYTASFFTPYSGDWP